MTGTISGATAGGHRVQMFSSAEGVHYAGVPVSGGSAGTWTASINFGNNSASGPPTITYDICLYDIDAEFSAYLDGRSNPNAGMKKIPAAGTAKRLSCTPVTWHRPTS